MAIEEQRQKREIVRLYGVDPEVSGAIEPGDMTAGQPSVGGGDQGRILLEHGVNCWVIDARGEIVVGHLTPHWTLSGGHAVAGAGKVKVDVSRGIVWLGLNHSGHYHPPLTAEYARFVYDVFRDRLGGLLVAGCVVEGLLEDRGIWITVRICDRLLLGGPEPLAAFLEGRG